MFAFRAESEVFVQALEGVLYREGFIWEGFMWESLGHIEWC